MNVKKSNTKKLISLITAIMIALTMISMPTSIDLISESVSAAESNEIHKTKVPNGYVGVYTIEDLYNIRNAPKGNYILMNDIDLSSTAPGGDWDMGNGWEPIPEFYGTLDGNGYKISNMDIHGNISNIDYNNFGLFGMTRGTVKSLGMTDINIDIIYDGTPSDDKEIYIGGILGIVGYNLYGSSWYGTDISNCFTTGKINVNVTNIYSEKQIDLYVGGICGHGRGESDKKFNVSECYNYSDINIDGSVSNLYVGGICGYLNSGYNNRLTNIYTVGKITSFCTTDGKQNIGEITGRLGYYDDYNYNYEELTCTYYSKNNSDYTAIGNQLDRTEQNVKALIPSLAKSQSGYNFDFSNTWYMDKLCGYPYPQLRANPMKEIASFEFTPPTKTEYSQGESLDFSGSLIKLTYKDGTTSESELTKDYVSAYNTNISGRQTIKVFVEKYNSGFDINITGTPLTTISDNSSLHKTKVPNYYIGIYTIEDLYNIRNKSDGNYILMNDIDLSETAPGGDWDMGNGWEPIPKFYGTLDGNGYKISNMDIHGNISNIDYNNFGLFGMTRGTVKNLGMTDINIDIIYDGTPRDDKKICIGGILGIVGYDLYGSSWYGTDISNCFMTGKINVNATNIYSEKPIDLYVGGICGHGRGDDNNKFKVSECYNSVDINIEGSVTNLYVGGAVGRASFDYDGYINNVYNTGKITNSISIEKKSLVGEIVGYASEFHYSDIKNLYYLKNNSQYTAFGDNGDDTSKNIKSLIPALAKSQSGYNFDFANTWYMDKLCGYPYPQLKANPMKEVTSFEFTPPTKTEYTQGETLDFTGSILKLTYKDGTTVENELTSDYVSGYDMNTLGAQVVKVSVGGCETTFNIRVAKVTTTTTTTTAATTTTTTTTTTTEKTTTETSTETTTIATSETTTTEPETTSTTVETTTEVTETTVTDVETTTTVSGTTTAETSASTIELTTESTTSGTSETTTESETSATAETTAVTTVTTAVTTHENIFIAIGEKIKLALSDEYDNLKWESDNPDVADVIEGLLTGISEGFCKISAITDDIVGVYDVTVYTTTTETTAPSETTATTVTTISETTTAESDLTTTDQTTEETTTASASVATTTPITTTEETTSTSETSTDITTTSTAETTIETTTTESETTAAETTTSDTEISTTTTETETTTVTTVETTVTTAEITHENIFVAIGEKIKLAISDKYDNIAWESDNPDIADVIDGLLTGISEGFCNVYAIVDDTVGIYDVTVYTTTTEATAPAETTTATTVTTTITTEQTTTEETTTVEITTTEPETTPTESQTTTTAETTITENQTTTTEITTTESQTTTTTTTEEITSTSATNTTITTTSAVETTTETTTKNISFSWNRDNWNFVNISGNGDFNSSKYIEQIGEPYLTKLKKSLSNIEYSTIFRGYNSWDSAWIYEKWGGSCYGMSSLLLLANSGKLPYSDYQLDADNLYDFSKPSENPNIESLITYYQMLQIKPSTQNLYKSIAKRSNKENIQNIISLIDETGKPVLVGFSQQNWGGHAIVAYDYEYGNWKINGTNYQGRLLICDPNHSDSFDADYCVYFNTNSYNWTIPVYEKTAYKVKSVNGAVFNYVGNDLDLIDEGGYLGTSKNKTKASSARLDAYAAASNCSINKVDNSNGKYDKLNANEGDIDEDYSVVLHDDSNTVSGYNLRDTNASYKFSQSNPQKMELVLNYGDSLYTAYSEAGYSTIFDRSGKIIVNSDSSDYSIGLTFNEDYPTDWFSMKVEGSGVDTASLEKSKDGYILRASNLNDVTVLAYNKSDSASVSFSAEGYDSCLLYEIDKKTIGIKVDADNNGTYETEINTKEDIVVTEPAITNKNEGVTTTTTTTTTTSTATSSETTTSATTCNHNLEHKTWGKCLVCGEIPNPVDISKAVIEARDLMPAYEDPDHIEIFETVTYDGYTLVRDIDYVIPKDKIIREERFGECTFTIEGIGCFTGENKTGKFNIHPCPGDANLDGKINVRDAAYIAKMLAQGKAAELPQSADFNGDGKVNVRDAAAIAKLLASSNK